MSNRQGVVKRDFLYPIQKAIGDRLRGGALPADCTKETLLTTTLLTSLSPAINQGRVVVHDYMGTEKMSNPPYVNIGDDTDNPDDTKGGSGSQVTVTLHVFSQYNGKKEVAYIGNQILLLLTQAPLDLSADGFSCYGLLKEFERDQKEGNFTHRIMRFRMWVQDVQTPQPIN